MAATQTTPGSDATAPGITMDNGQLAQLCYHVRWSAALAADGRTGDSAPHSILAGALLDVLGGEQLTAASAALDLPDVTTDHASATATAHREAAAQLGLQLVAHFTSDGRHDLADLYHEATRRVSALPPHDN
jgi:hypothetical protein